MFKALSKVADLSERAAEIARSPSAALSKVVGEASATAASVQAQVQASVQDAITAADEVCDRCGRKVSGISKATLQASMHECRVCTKHICDACHRKTDRPIPEHLWASSKERPKGEKSSDATGYVCATGCFDRCLSFWISELSDSLRIPFLQNTKNYLDEPCAAVRRFYSRPEVLEDSKMRQAIRIAILASKVAEVAGYSDYVLVAKAVISGTFGVQMFLSEQQYKMFLPLMEMMKSFNISGPNGMILLYYLSCAHELERSADPQRETRMHAAGSPGVIQPDCPPALLQYVNRYAPAANWLYAASLPKPHDDVEWSNWYLGRVVAGEGWTVLASSAESMQLPNNISCPAFAVVARVRENSAGEVNEKEALVVIRGTASFTDWTINIKDRNLPMTYLSGPAGAAEVLGCAHEGMLSGARVILEHYGVAAIVYKLMLNGFDVKTVGHSLGASTACLLAAELNSNMARIRSLVLGKPVPSATTGTGTVPGIEAWTEALAEQRAFAGNSSLLPSFAASQRAEALRWLSSPDAPLPRIKCIGYGMPPCVNAVIADAMAADGLVAVVVNCDDGVPRLSRSNTLRLAIELRTSADKSGPAEKWKLEDQAAVKRYAETYGRAQDFTDAPIIPATSTSSAATAEATSAPSSSLFNLSLGGGDSASSAAAAAAKERSNEEELAALRVKAENSIPLVVPGTIVLIRMENGVYRTCVADHRLPSLQRLRCLRGIVDHHAMSVYRTSLAGASASASASASSSVAVKTRRPPVWESPQLEPGVWRRCYVCECDPTWASITRSDAARITVTHNCRMCGHIVCAVCSPSGDQVPGEGLGEFETLSDYRTPLPQLGLFSPQRVCIRCYMSLDDPAVAPI